MKKMSKIIIVFSFCFIAQTSFAYISGKNKANEQSFKKAMYVAIDIFKNRKLYSEITENPLHIGTIKKER